MTEKETQAKEAKASAAKKAPAKAAKPAAEKKPAAKKAEKKPAAKPAAAKPAKVKKEHTGGNIRVVQVGSPIGRQSVQRQTLIGLGLNKLNRERVLEDTPAVRGMVERVKHLVKVSQA